MSTDKHPDSVPALLDSLRHLRDTNPKAVRATVHLYPPSVYADANNGESSSSSLRARKITSWKMTEHMYFNSQNPFPTLARGLFTEQVEDVDPLPPNLGTTRPKDRIVARGYDKFFNIDEVEWTNWSAMQTHTQAPYHLTLKSNGCLILISALSPSHLVVASKHSLGTTTESQTPDTDGAENGIAALSLNNTKEKQKGKQVEEKGEHEEAKAHAEVGRGWVKRTLSTKGKTEAQLAQKLWDGNMTAVLELCDDSFEEHVIATPAYWTGLHLHGLNYNTPHFSTASPADVTSFAQEFGFIQTKYVELQTSNEVKKFTDDVAKTGSWEGDMIEGFVVRCTVSNDLPVGKEKESKGKPPYRPGAPFFFKVKFEEPYLLYRQWREMTRLMLPLLEKKDAETETAIWKKVRSRTKRPEVGVYAEWCGKMMKEEPGLFETYEKGVVRVRERFLQWVEGDGKKIYEDARAGKFGKNLAKGNDGKGKSREGLPKKWLLVPVAVPGCGKTLIGVALSKLFGFAHTQSDDITAKRTAPTFLKNITTLLQTEDVVYADRNNHILKHYEELGKIAESKQLQKYDLRMIGIVWDIDTQPYHRTLRICSERVVTRGDNHQTLRPDPTMEAEHEVVVGQFLRNFTAPDPALFDTLIEVQVVDTSREVLAKIVNGLVERLDVKKPTDEEIDRALDEAGEYKVTTPYHQIAKVGKPIRYFGLAPEIDLSSMVTQIISSIINNSARESANDFFEGLKSNKRITAKPHVTLSHEKNVSDELELLGKDGEQKKLWDTCKGLAEEKYSPIWEYDLTHLIWDDRVMTLSLSHLRPKQILQDDGEKDTRVKDVDLDAVLPDETKKYLHITVGTKNEEIPAYESRSLMRVLRKAIDENKNGRGEGEVDEIVQDGGKVRWVNIDHIVKGEGRVRGMF